MKRRFWISRMVVGLCAALALMALCAGAAAAAQTHTLLASFGSFADVQGIAVDQQSGDVYVYDASEGGKVYKFDSSGNPSNFSLTNTNEISQVGAPGGEGEGQIAVDSSSGPAKGDIYIANGSFVAIYGPDGKWLGELNGNVSSEVPGAPWGEPCGVAVDPEGHIYVGLYPGNVNKYTPTASPASNTDYSASLNGLNSVCNIAADSEGNLYADSFPSGPITKYDALQFGALQASGSEVAGEGQTLAVDPTTDYLYADAGSKFLIYDAAGALSEELVSPSEYERSFANSHGVAVNGQSHDMYIADDEHGRVQEFSPSVLVPDVTTGSAEPHLETYSATLKGTVNPDGIEASCYFEVTTNNEWPWAWTAPCTSNPGSGTTPVEVSAEAPYIWPGYEYQYRLVATNEDGRNVGEVKTFIVTAPPLLEAWAEEVNLSTGTVGAWVQPQGSDTTYRVEYGTDTSYGSVAPSPEGTVAGNQSAQRVAVKLSGLRTGTTYHYRMVATNTSGTTTTADKSFTTFTPPASEQADTCPNARYRVGASAGLPDCRAYEMVSPANKNGADVNAMELDEFWASPDGEHIEFPTRTGMEGTLGSGGGGYTTWIASRGSAGWSSKGATPPTGPTAPFQFSFGETTTQYFSEDLDRALVAAYDLPNVGGAIPERENMYLEETATGHILEAVNRFEGPVEPVPWWELDFVSFGVSADLGVVTFEMRQNAVAPATGNAPKLYALDHGKVHLVGILPDNSVSAGGSTSVRSEYRTALPPKDTVSTDGSRIFFMSPVEGPPEPQLYVRENETRTVLISESEGSEPIAEAHNVHFQTATPDGKHVVFTTSDRLTDSDPGGPGTALYLYSDGPDPEHEANLTFIARFAGMEEGRGEGRVVKAISEDGSHIYFDSEYDPEALPFETAGVAGLFLWDKGQVRQIAPTPGAREGFDSQQEPEEAEIAPNGRQVAFLNMRALTTAETVSLVPELYLYDENSNSLKCVSCPPTGAAAAVGIDLSVKATGPTNPGYSMFHQPRFFSRDGRYLFFNTKEALVPQDTNGLSDAYEYNLDTGKLSLLSSGTGEYGTWFVDASADGRDAFLVTRQSLAAGDHDKLVDLYDARIEGGYPEPLAPPPPCAGDACQGVPSAPPSFNTASEFHGLGNPAWEQAKRAIPHRPTRAQRLKRALRACRKLARKRRAACRARARRRFAAAQNPLLVHPVEPDARRRR